MSKILNTKTLLIALVVLIAIYFISTLGGDKERSFKSELVTVDTSEVTKIVVTPKIGSGDDIIFTRTGQEWKLESGGKTYKPDIHAANQIFTELLKMRTERVVATNKSKWDELQVSDSTGTRVRFYDGSDVVADIYIGKFSYTQPKGQQTQQNRGKMSTCVRPAEGDNVYVVDGFIKMSIPAKVDGYRSKTLSLLRNEDITKITLGYPEGSYTLQKQGAKWLLNAQPTDSAKTMAYVSKLCRITGSTFIDDVKPESSTPGYTVKIEGNNFAPVEIKAFPADSVNQFIVVSSLIPDSQFSGSKGKLFERVFPSIPELLGIPKEENGKK
jgi:hypothetical protein